MYTSDENDEERKLLSTRDHETNVHAIEKVCRDKNKWPLKNTNTTLQAYNNINDTNQR